MAKSDLTVYVSGDTKGLSRAFGTADRDVRRFNDRAARGFKTLGTSAGMLDSRLGKLAKAASLAGAGYLAIAEAKQAVNTTTELAKATIGLNKNLGLSVQTASEWAAVAKVRGVETKALNMAFGSLSKAMEAASDSSSKQAAAFRQLGLSQDQLKASNFNEVLGGVANGLKDLDAGAARTAITMRLFGRGWQTIVPILRDGAKGMEEQLALARKYGATFSGGTIKSMQDFIAAQREAQFATLGLQVAFGTQLAPALAKLIPSIARFINQMRTGTGSGGELRRTLEDLWPVLRTILVWSGRAGKAIMGFSQFVRDVARTIGRFFNDVWTKPEQAFKNFLASVLRGMGRLFDVAGKLPLVGDKFDKLGDKARSMADDIQGVGSQSQRSSGRLRQLGDKIRDLPKNTSLKVTLDFAAKAAGQAFQLEPFGEPRTLLEKAIARGARQVAGANAGKARQLLSLQFGGAGGNAFGGAVGGTMGKAQQVARKFGLNITSGYRSPEHNASVGGVPNSLHTHGTPANPGAIDLVGPLGAMQQGLAFARAKFGLKEGLIHDVGSGLHLHLGFFAKGGKALMDQLAVVGEKGPELVSLPQGAEVFSHSNSKQMMAAALGAGVPGFAGGGIMTAAKAAFAAGFRGKNLIRMVAEAGGESGYNPGAVGDGGSSKGLWQIHTGYNPWAAAMNLFDPFQNAKAAMRIFRSQGVGAWHADHTPYIGAATKAVARLGGGGGGSGSGGRYPYPLGQKGNIIGTPHSGTHTLGNWQSDNAVDIRVPSGTPVFAVTAGTISKVSGDNSDPSSRFNGFQVTLQGKNNAFFYTHLSSVAVKAGQKVRKGQRIGTSGAASDVPHLHFGQQGGDPMRRIERSTVGWTPGGGGGGKPFGNMPSPAEIRAQTPVKGPRTTPDIVSGAQDFRHEQRWSALSDRNIPEGGVSKKEFRQADRAYRMRQKVLQARIKKAQARIKKIRRALQGKLRPATRQRLLAELGTLTGNVQSWIGESKTLTKDFQGMTTPEISSDGEDPYLAQFDYQSALARLTPGTEDDLAALRGREWWATMAFNNNVASGNTVEATKWANELANTREAIEQLTGQMAEANRLQAERDAINKELVENQRKLILISETQGPSLIAAVVSAVNGGIGGRYGLGNQTPSFAGVGGLARY